MFNFISYYIEIVKDVFGSIQYGKIFISLF